MHILQYPVSIPAPEGVIDELEFTNIDGNERKGLKIIQNSLQLLFKPWCSKAVGHRIHIGNTIDFLIEFRIRKQNIENKDTEDQKDKYIDHNGKIRIVLYIFGINHTWCYGQQVPAPLLQRCIVQSPFLRFTSDILMHHIMYGTAFSVMDIRLHFRKRASAVDIRHILNAFIEVIF